MNEQSIFNEALDRGDPAARSAYLDEACAGDLALRERVEALLTSHAEAGNFLGKLAPERIAEELKREQTDDETQGENPEENKSSEEDLSLLTPSDKPGVLGRLGHYEVLEVIGRGGMGIVLRAFDDKLHRVVAIKVMAPALAATSPPRKRFLREARAAAQVRHEHVVDIHAVEDQPIPYLVMEYVSGETLQQKLDRVGPLETPEVLRLGQQIARGLAAAHAQGLIHRDIKPSNILLEKGADERVKITDFGLARAADDVSLTQSGMIAGTPMYMAPEQTLGEAIDHRADLFSLGSVLYTMCSGRPPFRATTSMATLKRVAEDQPRPIREIIPEVPEWLCDIIARLHAKKPEERFQSAKEVADLLGQCIQHLEQPTSAPKPASIAPLSPTGRRAGVEGQSQPATSTPLEDSGRATQRRRRWAVAAAVLLVVLGGFTLTEATGVTNVRATMIRIFTPEGTLVVETDDPAVKVTVEGDGDLVITGAGPQEVRLKAGSYRLRATKDGKAVKLDRDLVAITRGDRQIVRVRLEGEAPAAVAPKAEPGAFVVLSRRGMEFRKFDTLAEAVRGASAGDTIEVRGNGPFVTEPVSIGDRALVIRAGNGFRPVIKSSAEHPKADFLLKTEAPLVLEGLELEGKLAGDMLSCSKGPLRVANCRLHLTTGSVTGIVIATTSADCELRNCEIFEAVQHGPGAPLLIRNCIHQSGEIIYVSRARGAKGPDSIRFIDNTSHTADGFLRLVFNLDEQPDMAKGDGQVKLQLQVEASGNVLDAKDFVVGWHFWSPSDKKIPGGDAQAFVKQRVDWQGQGNLFAVSGPYLGPYKWEPPKYLPEPEKAIKNLAGWRTYWGIAEPGSSEGQVKYQGGDPLGKLRAAPEKLTPDDFRLRDDSAGYRARKDGKDLGADVDLVGPGKGYERWKQTPEYQQWLKETGQKK